MKGEAWREAALKRGADELQDRLEWVLRKRPRALAIARREYVALCVRLHVKIQRATRKEVQQ
jgi:hypothetical protein